MTDGEFSIEERVLCSDDTCIGLVGPDGRCKECGLAYQGDEPLPLGTDLPLGEQNQESEAGLQSETHSAKEDPSESVLDPLERVCCSDETCIGIIGEDGLCGTCGKAP
jgi:hypothetical protein